MRWLLVVLALLGPAASAAAAPLQAGAGRSDVTPPTGFATMGYVRSDAVARGVHTRLFARAIVLRSGGVKVALVATDLGFTPGGLVADVADELKDRGFSERNLVVSASHTHSGPAGFSNFGADNFVAPTTGTPTDFSVRADPQLYGFLVDRIALAVARADDDLGPARAGWGRTTITNLTDNRSIEAHLADHGLDLAPGTGNASQDPLGAGHTIDPTVDVLRVDRVTRHRRIPLGAWMTFADHGTVNPYTFGVYNADHHGAATRRFEQAVRRIGHVPARDEVVGAYGNADAGDLTAAFHGRGPAAADRVGSREARAMLRAWRQAGNRLSGTPTIDSRWTRSCFCGREIDGHVVATDPVMGLPFLTGSEENRGPLFDIDGISHEGDRLPIDNGAQGRKIPAVTKPAGDFPTAIPLAVWRIGDGALVTVPGEMTAEMGRRTREATLGALQPAGVRQVSIAGYANEYIHYLTTPEEYEQQAYEGGSTLFGHYSGDLVRSDLVTLAQALAAGRAAPDPVAFDPRNGLVADHTPYSSGAAAASVIQEPTDVERLTRAAFSWQGAERGYDRPLDRPFVTVERRAHHRWHAVTDDLGLQILWRVTDSGAYTAEWQVPPSAPRGSYRFVVTANRYRLASSPLRVRASRALHAIEVDGRRRLAYPDLDPATDLTDRPHWAAPAGATQDRWGNRAG